MMFLTAQGGFLGPFAWVFGKIMDFIYNLLAGSDGMANLGLCIILFTVVAKLILFPLNFKQQKSAKINMVIQPEIQKIQKKYKDKKDQESMLKQQQEIQAVYSKYGTSMTGGCLPTFIQLPIIYALYRVIQNMPAYIESIKAMYEPIANAVLKTQGINAKTFMDEFVTNNNINGATYALKTFRKLDESKIGVDNIIDVLSNFGVSNLNSLLDTIGKSSDLSANVSQIEQVHSFILGINISEAPGYHLSWALLIPILSALFNYLSMKVSNNGQTEEVANNTMMKSMQITMPLMSIFFCITLPAGIGIYWAMSALISLLTQLGVNFYYDHQDMDKILAKQMEKAAKKAAKNGGKKSFMERMMDQSAEAQEELEKQQAMRKNSAASLKNYIPSSDAQKAVDENKKKQYKSGSIGAKANIMMNYNNTTKEEK